MRSFALRITFITTLLSCQPQQVVYAWHDKTHIPIAEAPGLNIWYSAAAADVAKSKEEFYPVEGLNQYFSNKSGKKVAPAMAMAQVERYNQPGDRERHLHGAIIERSVRSNIGYIRCMMQVLVIKSEEELARDIAAIAESSWNFGNRMKWRPTPRS